MVTETEKAQQELADSLTESGVSVVPNTFMKVGDKLTPDSIDPSVLSLKVTSLGFRGYVEVWDTITGIMSLQPWWLLWQTMAKVREDGSRVFTRTNPQIPLHHGADLTCPLNPESPEYPRLKAMGFRDCRKKHIPHRDGLNRHVRKSHGRAWEAMEQDRADRIREEDRQLQRDMLEAMTGAAVEGIQTKRTSGYLRVGDTSSPLPSTITITDSSDNTETVVMESTYPTWIPFTPHAHVYREKKAGAPCKVDGCSMVRKEDAKTRTKKS